MSSAADPIFFFPIVLFAFLAKKKGEGKKNNNASLLNRRSKRKFGVIEQREKREIVTHIRRFAVDNEDGVGHFDDLCHNVRSDGDSADDGG